jgi:hypothetical protein
MRGDTSDFEGRALFALNSTAWLKSWLAAPDKLRVPIETSLLPLTPSTGLMCSPNKAEA